MGDGACENGGESHSAAPIQCVSADASCSVGEVAKEPSMPAPEASSGESADPPSSRSEPPSPSSQHAALAHQVAWPWVLCVIGLDYLSTLAYQPSIAFAAAGRLAPVATILVAAVTLFLALPVYCYIAG